MTDEMNIPRYQAMQILDFYKILDGYAEKITSALAMLEMIAPPTGEYPKDVSFYWPDGKGGRMWYALPADEDITSSLELLYGEVVRDAAQRIVNSLEYRKWHLECVEERWKVALFKARYKGFVPISRHLQTDYWIGDEFIKEMAEEGQEL